jgi:hypothetical protein
MKLSSIRFAQLWKTLGLRISAERAKPASE